MRYLYSLIVGLGLGAGSVFIHNIYPPVGIVLTITATCVGIWATGRLWGKRIYRFIAAVGWGFVVLRAVYPGVNQEFLILGNTSGFSLVNIGFIALVIAILTPL